VKLREIHARDLPRVLELNEASVSELSELDEERLRWLLSLAHLALAVELDGELVAFAIAIAPDTAYDSVNYHWFSERFERFLYLDRIVVAESHRRLGIGARLYDAVESAAGALERVVCEVNLDPPNPISMAFHTSRGYAEIDRLTHEQGKLVALLSKELAPGHSRLG
jgi:predicted GNAT superfamily acetyltransferase